MSGELNRLFSISCANQIVSFFYTSFPRGGVPYSYIGKTHFDGTCFLPLILLRLFFSMRLSRFSSLLLASSTSWCSRHLWKFSTTTPTNMFSTKKLTIRRKEMKYSSIQGLLLVMGWKMKRQKERRMKELQKIYTWFSESNLNGECE